MIEPSGCRHDGIPRREHFRRWTKEAGWHKWTMPTQDQILARMLQRRANRTAQRHTAEDQPDLTVTITIDARPAINAIRNVEGQLMFMSHPDLREMDH